MQNAARKLVIAIDGEYPDFGIKKIKILIS